MKKNLVKKALIALPVIFSLSSCGLHYQKAITLDEGRTLLSNASSAIADFDPNSRTSYSFSLTKEKFSNRIDFNWVTDSDALSGNYSYDANAVDNPWNTFSMSCTRTISGSGWGEEVEEGTTQYAFRMRSASVYEILEAGEYVEYAKGSHPILDNYLREYPSDVYKTFSQSLTNYLIGKMANIGVAETENDLFGYTCLSTGNNDLVLILQSRDFSFIEKDLIQASSWPGLFSEEDGLRESYSSINFIEAHYEGGYLTSFITGYDQQVDEEIREEEAIKEYAKNIDNSYRVTFTF